MRRNWLTISIYGLAVVMFLLISTYAVMYATGYKVDWQTMELKKTGFILVESYPKGANLKINGKDEGTTPETIKRLLPGVYQTELAKDNYRAWHSNTTVVPGLVTELRNILLTATDLKLVALLGKPIISVIPNNDNTKISFLQDKAIWLWDVRSKKAVTIVNTALIRQHIKNTAIADIANGKLTLINFAPDNQTLLFQSIGLSNQYYLIVNTNSGIIRLISTGFKITNWKWLNTNEIAWLQNAKLNILNISSSKIQPVTTDIIDYSLFENNLYVAQKNKLGKIMLNRISKAGKIEAEITELPLAQGYYLGKIKNKWFLISTLNTLSKIWIEETVDGKFTWKLLADNVLSKVLWDEKYLVYQQNQQLTIADWEKLDRPTYVTAFKPSEMIHFSFDTILYIENKTLKSINITGQNIYELLPVTKGADVVITEPQISQLVFIDAKTNQLTEATLREKTSTLF